MKLTLPQSPSVQRIHALLWRGLALLRPVVLRDQQERAIYYQMITRLRRDTLVLLMLIGLPLSLIFGVQLFFGAWADRSVPPWLFATHVGRVVALAGWTLVFLWRRQVLTAWMGAIAVSLGTLLLQIGLLREPGLLVFALFMLAGPLLVFPLRATLPLTGALLTAFGVIMLLTPGVPAG